MPKQFAKLDANTLQIVEQVVPPTVTSTYVYDDLVTILASLQDRKITFNLEIDAKIADAQANVDAATSLGIVAIPINSVLDVVNVNPQPKAL